jgi:tRNA(fMet)-specific endonuclease VapC
MNRVMLDANMVSHLVKEHDEVRKHFRAARMSACISVVAEAQLRYGLAKHPHSKKLNILVPELLLRLDILPWTSDTAQRYGVLRAELERLGKTLAALDLMIAAHALEAEAVLATSDRAFAGVPGLRIVDWSVS